MITRLIYNNKIFKIQDRYKIDFSNNEVTFNDITIDFSGYSIADLPFKYQEVTIRESETEEEILNGKKLFTGYVDDFDIPEMYYAGESRNITLSLLSPLKMATKRSISLIGTYKIQEAIQRIVQPLLDDGFRLKEINVPYSQITVSYVLQTVEYCMNDIGYKRNIWWFIDENKNITINSIDHQFGKETKKLNTDKLFYIKPSIESVDYANIINFKNIRLIYSQNDSVFLNTEVPNNFSILNLPKKVKKGDIVTFNNPIILDEEYLRNYIDESSNIYEAVNLFLGIKLNDTTFKFYQIKISLNKEDSNYNKYISEGSISFNDEDGDEAEIVLQRDNFFSNLITGFKWNVDSNATIEQIRSDIALRYTTMKFMYSPEINSLKGIISDSGQIEKNIDFIEKWTTLNQLTDYARSLMVQNSNTINQVVIKYTENQGYEVGDIIHIDLIDYYISGNFVIAKKSTTYVNEDKQEWEYTLKTTDLISSYIDLFRPAQEETSSNTIDSVILSEFVEEKIKETHSIELNKEEHTLEFTL